MTKRGQEAIDYWSSKTAKQKTRIKTIGIIIAVAVVVATIIHYT